MMHWKKLAVGSFSLISIIVLSGIQVSVTASEGSITPVCERSTPIKLAISKALGYPCPAGNCPCEKIDRAGLETITGLVLSGRGLATIKPGDFSGLTSLQKLDLSDNQLRGLPPDFFDDLASVNELRMAKNRFRGFPYSQLNKLPRLRTLSLDGALLAEMPTDAFDELAGKPGVRFIGSYNSPVCRPYSSGRSRDPALTKSDVARVVNRTAPAFASMEKYHCIAWRALSSTFLVAFDLEGRTPGQDAPMPRPVANLHSYRRQPPCRGLYDTPMAA